MTKSSKKYTWDLKKIIKDDKDFKNKINYVKSTVKKIVKYKGRIFENKDTLYEFLKLNESLERTLDILMMYVELKYSLDMLSTKNEEDRQVIDKIHEDVSKDTTFTITELVSLEYKDLKSLIQSDIRLKPYLNFFFRLYRHKLHVLSEVEENIVTKLTSSYRNNENVFEVLTNSDIVLGDIKDEKGKKHEYRPTDFIKYSESSNRVVRESAYILLHDFYKAHINTVSATYSGHVKESFVLSKLRKYKSPLERSLFNDNITKKLYETLINVTKRNVHILERYYEIKRKSLGLKDFHIYDQFASIANKKNVDITYDESITELNEALKPLGEDYLNNFNHYVNERYVDVYPKKGKRSGAYQLGIYDHSSYVFLNYNNTRDDLLTFAHEMGHALHSHYSVRNQMYEYSNYPIFLAEIASTVNEELVNSYLLSNSKNNEEKISILCSYINKIKSTIYRQTMFAEFEKIVFDKYKTDSTLTRDFFCDEYFKLNKEYFGNKIIVDDFIKYEWARIPHFYRPFYVYKYSTGLIAAMIIADKILNEKGFEKKYIEKFLSAGCSKFPLEIIKDLGVDLEDEKTMQRAFNVLEEKIDLLEKLISSRKK